VRGDRVRSGTCGTAPITSALRTALVPLIIEKGCKFLAGDRAALDQVWYQSSLLQSHKAIPGCDLKMESFGATPNSNEEVILAVRHVWIKKTP
jgi:hypothetical protein